VVSVYRAGKLDGLRCTLDEATAHRLATEHDLSVCLDELS